MEIIPYQTKIKKLSGTNYAEVRNQVLTIFNKIKKRTKRRPHVRSAYFNKQKIFFDYFWPHLFQKSPKERLQRLPYFEAAVDLIRYSRNHPSSMQNPNQETEILHRFTGLTKDKKQFYVQIKENKRNNKKYFISCFPSK